MEEHLPGRCGVSDALQSTLANKWRKRSLTYAVAATVPGLSRDRAEALIAAALKSWTDVVPELSIVPVPAGQQADLIFATGRGPRAGFDGPHGTLAWAQLPQGNDTTLLMRFDLDEDWTEPLFLAVAAHEIGHLLGLDHSLYKTALMYPYVNLGIARPQSQDDIPRIQTLYPPATSPAPVPKPIPPAPFPVPPAPERTVWELFLLLLKRLFGGG